ncbi:MAG: DUF421 domain-containing protein [Aggregatilineales bacterium]
MTQLTPYSQPIFIGFAFMLRYAQITQHTYQRKHRMFFSSWEDILRVVIVGTLAYIALIFLLRISGKRTLSKMNAFDFIVTVALGSTLATVLLSEEVALLEGVTAFGMLIFLQFSITWLQVRSERFQDLIKAEPSLLYYQGRYIDSTMKHQRVTREEIHAAMRDSGMSTEEGASAVILETDGSFTVIRHTDAEEFTTLEYVHNYPGAVQTDTNN